MNRNRSTGIVGTAAGLFFILTALQLPASTVPDDIGPTAFPVLAGMLMLIPGLFLIFQKGDEKEAPFLTRAEWNRFLILLAAFFLYAALLWAVGFLLATPVAVTLIAWLFARGKGVAFWKLILFAVLLTAVVYLSFYTLLGMKLPIGKFIKIII